MVLPVCFLTQGLSAAAGALSASGCMQPRCVGVTPSGKLQPAQSRRLQITAPASSPLTLGQESRLLPNAALHMNTRLTQPFLPLPHPPSLLAASSRKNLPNKLPGPPFSSRVKNADARAGFPAQLAAPWSQYPFLPGGLWKLVCHSGPCQPEPRLVARLLECARCQGSVTGFPGWRPWSAPPMAHMRAGGHGVVGNRS